MVKKEGNSLQKKTKYLCVRMSLVCDVGTENWELEEKSWFILDEKMEMGNEWLLRKVCGRHNYSKVIDVEVLPLAKELYDRQPARGSEKNSRENYKT